MSRKTFERIAYATLVLPLLGTYYLGQLVAAWLLSLDDDFSALLVLLGYVLTLLGCVIVWALALLPLRRMTDLPGIIEEFKQGGFAEADHRERAAIRERETSDDPAQRARHHFQFAKIGAALSAFAALLTWVLWLDGMVLRRLFALALVFPGFTIYHLAQGLRMRKRIPR